MPSRIPQGVFFAHAKSAVLSLPKELIYARLAINSCPPLKQIVPFPLIMGMGDKCGDMDEGNMVRNTFLRGGLPHMKSDMLMGAALTSLTAATNPIWMHDVVRLSWLMSLSCCFKEQSIESYFIKYTDTMFIVSGGASPCSQNSISFLQRLIDCQHQGQPPTVYTQYITCLSANTRCARVKVFFPNKHAIQ